MVPLDMHVLNDTMFSAKVPNTAPAETDVLAVYQRIGRTSSNPELCKQTKDGRYEL
eukprot:COSAG02_NODE_44399_length_366_cov_1.352060_1_plen_55_part_10